MFQIHPIIKKKHNPQKNSYIKLHWQYWAAPFFCDPMCTINKDLFLRVHHPPRPPLPPAIPPNHSLGWDPPTSWVLAAMRSVIFTFNRRGFGFFVGRGLDEVSHTLRIMGSQNWWFGDPRPLLYTSKPLYCRVQWFLWLQHISHMIWSHWLDLIFTFHHPTPSWGLADPYN